MAKRPTGKRYLRNKLENGLQMTPDQERDFQIIKGESVQLKNDIKDIKEKLSAMYYAIVGNDLTEDGGILQKLKSIESRLGKVEHEQNDLRRAFDAKDNRELGAKVAIGAVAAAIGYLIKLLWK